MANRIKIGPLLIILLSLLIGFAGCKAAKFRKKTADEWVIDLQKGVLLVRLQTGQRQADVLRQREQTAQAEALLSRRADLNDQIRAAFRERYDFSPVFFFEAPDSRRVRERQFAGILTDGQGQPVAASTLANQPFLAAEFGEVQAPAANAGLDALFMMDDQLTQLAAPFPFAMPTHLYPEEEFVSRAVAKLNLKLKDFYNKAVYREQKRELRSMRQR